MSQVDDDAFTEGAAWMREEAANLVAFLLESKLYPRAEIPDKIRALPLHINPVDET